MRLRYLRAHFLPRRFSPTGSYLDSEVDMALAYRLLVHAEIEAYLEDRAKTTIMSNVSQWKTDRQPRVAILSLLSHHAQRKAVEARFKANHGRIDRVECAVEAATDAYIHVIKTNHGIKEKNLLSILGPLGVVINQAWLIGMDSFGADRGTAAHSAIQAYRPPDPQTVWKEVKDIAKGLREIDKELDRIAC